MLKRIENIKVENYDFVIVGTGPAGISLAFQLKKNDNKKILIIEAGKFDLDDESQEYYKGTIINNCNLEAPDVSRIRAFGGTSMLWGGMCRELDEIDLKNWPINKSDLSPYTDEARKILRINRKFLKDKQINENTRLIDFQWSEPTIRFNEFYKDKILNDKNIDLLIETAITKIDGNLNVETAQLFDHKTKKYYSIKPKVIILACGAIENSRILLYSKKESKSHFLKNISVGKDYLIHPNYVVAKSLIDMSKIEKILDNGYMNLGMFFLSPTKNFIEEKKIGNVGLRIIVNDYPSKTKELLKDLLCIAPKYAKKIAALGDKKIDCANLKFFSSWEALPSETNYITLDENEVDNLGIPRVKVFANLNDDTKKTMRLFLEEVGKFFIDKKIGRLAVRDFLYPNQNTWPKDGYGGAHQMGGTKMGFSNLDSVVDKNLRAHGINNLFILGSSVFPTSGHANPTFTICQLAVRLGNHLEKKFS